LRHTVVFIYIFVRQIIVASKKRNKKWYTPLRLSSPHILPSAKDLSPVKSSPFLLSYWKFPEYYDISFLPFISFNYSCVFEGTRVRVRVYQREDSSFVELIISSVCGGIGVLRSFMRLSGSTRATSAINDVHIRTQLTYRQFRCACLRSFDLQQTPRVFVGL